MRWPEVVKSPHPTFSRRRLGDNSMQLGHSKFKISWHYEELQHKKTNKQADILNFIDGTACRPISGFPDPVEGVWRKRKEQRGKGTLCCDKRTEKAFFLGFCLYLFFFTSRGRDAQRGYTLKEGHSFEGLVSMAGVSLVSGKGLDGPSGAVGPCQHFKSIERVQVGGYMWISVALEPTASLLIDLSCHI